MCLSFFSSSLYYVVFILFHLLRSHSSSFDSSITRFAYNSDINTQRMTQNMLCTVRKMVCNISEHIFFQYKSMTFIKISYCVEEKSHLDQNIGILLRTLNSKRKKRDINKHIQIHEIKNLEKTITKKKQNK